MNNDLVNVPPFPYKGEQLTAYCILDIMLQRADEKANHVPPFQLLWRRRDSWPAAQPYYSTVIRHCWSCWLERLVSVGKKPSQRFHVGKSQGIVGCTEKPPKRKTISDPSAFHWGSTYTSPIKNRGRRQIGRGHHHRP